MLVAPKERAAAPVQVVCEHVVHARAALIDYGGTNGGA